MNYDVIIAGAGPVGLFLACELRLAKLEVLVLEAASDPSSPLKASPFGMRGLWGPSVEAFYRRGLLEALAAAPRDDGPGPRPGATRGAKGPAGHFGGLQFDHANIDASRWGYRLAGPSDTQIGTSMENIERVLTARARELGVEIRRGDGVTGLEDAAGDGGEVVVQANAHRFRTRWLVGCDGGRSTVRKLAGFDFVGTEPELTGYSLAVELADPSMLPMGRHHTATGTFTQWQPGVFGVAELDGGKYHRMELSAEHVQGVLRRVSGIDVTVTTVKLASTWTDRSKQATTYRKGHVLLAGDAAHIHSPLGGQGLNLGLGDAMNLGWKLAATIRGHAPDGLLDSYTAERHPLGARILEWTRAQVALMKSMPLQAVMRDLMATRDGATYFAERVWSATLRYDLGDRADTHPLVGRSCPDFELEDGTRLGELLREPRGVLLDFGGTLGPLEGIRHVTLRAKEPLGLDAVLVRPDGFVAWAGDATASSRTDLERAAARWFT